MMLEVKCGVRKGGSLTNLNWGKGRFDVATRLKAVLVKRDLMIHLKKTYSHFATEIEEYEGVGWFMRKFGVKEDGTGGTQTPDADADDGEEDEDEDGVEVSTFNSRAPLINLLERLTHNKMEMSLCKLAKESVPGKSLMLCAKDEMLQKVLDSVKEKYAKDFPPQQASQAGA